MTVEIITGDCREVLRSMPEKSAHCCVTSPPYFGLRDYGVSGQIGLEKTPDAFVDEMVAVFREVRRVLRDDGTLWLNLGDSYAGSGRGGNPDAGTKQGTNRGSQTIGVLYGRETGLEEERTRIRAQFAAERASGLKQKDLIGIPWMVAFALRADGWFLRSDIIWHKPNPMPESVADRPTSAHEHIFLFSKSQRYWYDAAAIKEPVSVEGWDDGSRVYGGVNKAGANAKHGNRTTGRVAGKGNAKTFRGGVYTGGKAFDNSAAMERDSHGNEPNASGMRNARNVWTVATQPFSEAHFATFPPKLIEPCIKAGCPVGGTVLDPFGGAGTTGLVADRLQRSAVLIELNPEYAAMARSRVDGDAPLFARGAA